MNTIIIMTDIFIIVITLTITITIIILIAIKSGKLGWVEVGSLGSLLTSTAPPFHVALVITVISPRHHCDQCLCS